MARYKFYIVLYCIDYRARRIVLGSLDDTK